jgi:hypothetical protein
MRKAGWEKAVAIKGGWEALITHGFETVRKP